MYFKKFFQAFLWICPVVALYWFCKSLDYRLETGWRFPSFETVEFEFFLFIFGVGTLFTIPLARTIARPYVRLVDKQMAGMVVVLTIVLIASLVSNSLRFFCSVETESLLGTGNKIWHNSPIVIGCFCIIYMPHILTKLIGGPCFEYGNIENSDEDIEEIAVLNPVILYQDPGL